MRFKYTLLIATSLALAGGGVHAQQQDNQSPAEQLGQGAQEQFQHGRDALGQALQPEDQQAQQPPPDQQAQQPPPPEAGQQPPPDQQAQQPPPEAGQQPPPDQQAQQPPPPEAGQQPPPDQQAQQPPPPEAGQQPQDQQAQQEQQQQQQFQDQMSQIRPEAHDMIGQTAVDQQGQELGEITDVIIGPQGQADAVVVQEGAVLGIGGREVAVPWDQVQISGDQVIVNMSQEELSQMPEYQSGN